MKSAFGIAMQARSFGKAATSALTAEEESKVRKKQTAETLEQVSAAAKQLAPVAQSLWDTDAAEDVEVLKAKIANHKHLRDTMPEPIKTLYANKVKVLQAKLRAAKLKKQQEAEDRASAFEWSNIGKGVGVTGIAVGASLIVLLLSLSRRRP